MELCHALKQNLVSLRQQVRVLGLPNTLKVEMSARAIELSRGCKGCLGCRALWRLRKVLELSKSLEVEKGARVVELFRD